jgi:hypothetical protein
MATAAREVVEYEKSGRRKRYVKKGGSGGRREGAGRKPWKPDIQRKEITPGVWRSETEEEAWERCRQAVRHYVAIGYPYEIIARIMQPVICIETLKKNFAFELENGKYIQDAKVAGTAYYLATSGRAPDMTRFWMRARQGWRDHGDLKTPTAPIQFQKIEGDDW